MKRVLTSQVFPFRRKTPEVLARATVVRTTYRSLNWLQNRLRRSTGGRLGQVSERVSERGVGRRKIRPTVKHRKDTESESLIRVKQNQQQLVFVQRCDRRRRRRPRRLRRRRRVVTVGRGRRQLLERVSRAGIRTGIVKSDPKFLSLFFFSFH